MNYIPASQYLPGRGGEKKDNVVEGIEQGQYPAVLFMTKQIQTAGKGKDEQGEKQEKGAAMASCCK